MGTSCTIEIEGIKFAQIYKHYDGYPEGTLQWLKDFNEDFVKNRGNDPEYKFAQLLRSSERDFEKYGLDDSVYTGWGVISYDEAWGQFEYVLHKDGSVTYKEVM